MTEQSGAVVASVDYRLAPEYHFPTAVEDGVDAVLYVARHAEELWLDVDKIAVSGFSAGGNMAFTVPLRLQEELDEELDGANEIAVHGADGQVEEEGEKMADSLPEQDQEDIADAHDARKKSVAILAAPPTAKQPITLPKRKKSSKDKDKQPPTRRQSIYAAENTIASPTLNSATSNNTEPLKGTTATDIKMIRQTRIAAIIAWYPSTDYTLSRNERRETNLRPDQELSAVFTELFDNSYLQPPTMNLANPYLSPSQATPSMLAKLPDDIVLYTCEWDMLREEGQKFKDKLEAMGKRVYHRMVLGVPHGWDKAPNPVKVTPGVAEHYRDACRELRRVFGGEPEAERWDLKKRGSVWAR